MIVRLHAHAIERLLERGATEEEVRATVTGGESSPAKFGRTGFRRNSTSTPFGGIDAMRRNRLRRLLYQKRTIGL